MESLLKELDLRHSARSHLVWKGHFLAPQPRIHNHYPTLRTSRSLIRPKIVYMSECFNISAKPRYEVIAWHLAALRKALKREGVLRKVVPCQIHRLALQCVPYEIARLMSSRFFINEVIHILTLFRRMLPH